MSTTSPNAENQAQKTRYDVHRSLQWKGKRYTGGNEIEATAEEIAAVAFQAWITHGWVAPIETTTTALKVRQQTTCVSCGWVGASPVKRPLKVAGRDYPVECPECSSIAVEPLPQGEPPAKAKAPAKVNSLTDPCEFIQIQPTAIDPAPYNPRKTFRPDKLQELAESIRTDGIIEPLIVRPVKGGRFEIVAGERRYRAAKIAGLLWLPCLVRPMDKITAIRVQGIENLLRDDLNPMEECGWFRALMTEGKYTVQDIRRETGLSEASIYARLKLEDCPPGIKKALEEGKIPASTAELVARIEDSDLRFAFMDAILFPPKNEPGEEKGGVLSFRQAKQWLEVAKAGAAREAEWKAKVEASPLAKTAAKVLTAAESDKVVSYGYVRDPQKYVRPVDVCQGDPKQRTYAEVAKAAGRELPAPILARDLASGKPMPILSRVETEKALAGLMRSGDELERLRKEETARRESQRAEEDKQRKEAAQQVQARGKNVVDAVKRGTLDAENAEQPLRFAVAALLDVLAVEDDDFAAALREMGVPVQEGEEATVATVEWRREYLDGCAARQLYAWLMWFTLRDWEFYSLSHLDEDRLWEAEILMGLRKDEPQTSAVQEDDADEEAA